MCLQRWPSFATSALLTSLPEQLRVDEGDDILQDLESRADQEIRPKGSDERTQEGRLVGSSFLAGQEHLNFLWAAFVCSSADMVGA